MWRWTKPWPGLAMAERWLLKRSSPRLLSITCRAEKGGARLTEPPIPWNADAVVIEAELALPPAARRKTSFALLLPGHAPLAPDALHTNGPPERFRLTSAVYHLFRVGWQAVPIAADAGFLHPVGIATVRRITCVA